MRRTQAAVVALALAALATALAGCAARPVMPEFDPNVRGSFGEFFWALPDGPDRDLPPELTPERLREAAGRISASVDEEDWEAYPVRVFAIFPNVEEAETQAVALRTLLSESAAWFADPANAEARRALVDPERMAPLTDPEIEAVLASGNAPNDRGIGWGGTPEEVDAAVTTVGPILVVTGIEDDRIGDVPPPHPLVGMLGGYGAKVMLEGDRLGEGAVVLDVSCRLPDDLAGIRVLDELGDAIVASEYHVIPPWVARPTEEQALARATVRRWQQAAMRAFEDATYQGYVQRLSTSYDDPEEYKAIVAELATYLESRAPGLVDGPVDAEVLALLAGRPQDSGTEAHRTWLREVGEPMGQYPLREVTPEYLFPAYADWATEPIVASIRVKDGRLDIAWATFGRFSTGGLQLLAYLGEQGCTQTRVGLVDYDEVRGD